MPDATNLYLFIVAALLLLIVQGPNDGNRHQPRSRPRLASRPIC